MLGCDVGGPVQRPPIARAATRGGVQRGDPRCGRPATPAPTAAVPSDPIAPGGHWDVAEGPCRALLDETDDDRAAIGMFYYGYLAAKLNLNVIDTSRIEGDLRHVFETCRDHRAMTIVAAFETLR